MRAPSDSKTRTNGSIGNLSTSDHYRLLAAERRRLVLQILTGEPPPVGLEGLAAEVAVREATGDSVDAATVKCVAISLHHTHLPILADAGLLAYDPESHRIEPDE